MNKMFRFYGTEVCFQLLVFVCLLGLFPQYAGAATPKPEVAFLPFNVQAAGKYAFLEGGASSMLATRIGSRAEITVVNDPQRLKTMSASWKSGKGGLFRQAVEAAGVDYIVAGALEEQPHDQVAIDVFVFSKMADHARHFSVTAQSGDKVFGAVDEVAWQITEKIFGVPRPAGEKVTESKEQKAEERFRTPHPDRLFRQERATGLTFSGGEDNGQGYRAVKKAESGDLDFELRSIEVGDLDKDGQDEIIAAADRKLVIFRQKGGRFSKIETLALNPGLKVYALYLADMNKNGRPEIYVNASNGDTPSSSILEFGDKGEYVYLEKNVPAYLRPLAYPGREPLLLMQKSAMDRLLSSVVTETTLTGNRLGPAGEEVTLPPQANIFNVLFVDFENDGRVESVVQGNDGKLSVYQGTRLVWRSEQDYGYGKNYLGISQGKRRNQADERIATYVPIRMAAVDLNGDGTMELLVGKNQLASPKFMPNLRYFDAGGLAILAWTGTGLTELSRSTISGNYVADFKVTKTTSPVSNAGMGSGQEKGEKNTAENAQFSDISLFIGRHGDDGLFSILNPFGEVSRIDSYGLVGVEKNNQ